MIQTQLLSQKAFKVYVSSLSYPDDIFWFDAYDPLNDQFLKRAVSDSKWLGLQSVFNPHARIVKTRHIKKVLNYMVKKDLYYPDFLGNFYSPNNPNFKQLVNVLQNSLHDGFIIRFQYLEAFRKLRKSTDFCIRLNTHLSKNASSKFYSQYSSHDYRALLNAHDSIQETVEYEGLGLENKLSLRELGIHVRENAKKVVADSNIQLSDDQLKGVWMAKSEEILTISNLKRLGNIIVRAHLTEYSMEIKRYRDEKKKEADRNRYTPTQKYSYADKSRLIEKLNKENVSQRKIGEQLGINKSTVERHLKKLK